MDNKVIQQIQTVKAQVKAVKHIINDLDQLVDSIINDATFAYKAEIEEVKEALPPIDKTTHIDMGIDC